MKNSSPINPDQKPFWQRAEINLGWHTVRDYLFILAGALIQAFAMRLFLVPGQLVSGGISGASQLINHYTHWPIGLMVFVGNVPLFLLGWRHLGGPKFVVRTGLAIAAFSFFTDFLGLYIPNQGMTHDAVLTTLYGGLMLGIGLGLVYRGNGTSGGSDILGRILNHRFGVSISQAYMMTDSIVVLAAGFVYGWDFALYGLVMIYVSGLAAEIITEGTSVFRTAIIVTNNPSVVAEKILYEMERGVTFLSGRGAYTGTERDVLYCVVSRSEVSQLKSLVKETDPKAFMVIGEAHEALGEGFRPLK
jgi:uncharacterized membrane-anchored protein YitT (DUF2179 family)